MKIHGMGLLLPLLFVVACGPRGASIPTENTPESLDVLTLKLRAREEEVRRLKQKLITSPAHSRFKEEADLDGEEERLTAVRLKLDVLRASDEAARPKSREEFNAAYADLTQFLHDVETRYRADPK